jgi:hypothetical protein
MLIIGLANSKVLHRQESIPEVGSVDKSSRRKRRVNGGPNEQAMQNDCELVAFSKRIG